jgi:hypothetical protein
MHKIMTDMQIAGTCDDDHFHIIMSAVYILNVRKYGMPLLYMLHSLHFWHKCLAICHSAVLSRVQTGLDAK